MKLVKLYSNDENFKTVTFSPGFNLILGEITDSTNLNKDSHNLGKTTLIDILDFMLLKKINKHHFFKVKKDKFSHHIFYLEIELNTKKYLTIKRSVCKNSKISFKISETKNNNFISETNWDYFDLALTTKEIEKNPKFILNNFLNFNVLQGYTYRDYLNYFLRTQYDYNDEFHLSKYRSLDSDWKPKLLDLLGVDPTPMIEKYKLDIEFNNQKNYIEKLKRENQIDPLEVDKINGLIQIKESEKKELETTLSQLDFYISDKNINRELVDKLEESISQLNKERYNLNLEIKSLENSFNKSFSFDLETTLKIFNETKIYFSEQLKKSYEELLQFNRMLTEDRNKYIKTTLESKLNQINKIDLELISLNEKKRTALDTLIESDVFKKYKFYEKNLINIEREIQSLVIKLDSLTLIEKETEHLDDLKDQIENLKKIIKKELDSVSANNSLYNQIRNRFSEFVKYVIDKPCLISILRNGSGNVDFKSEILSNDDGEVTAEDRGHTYKKILCACFDLAILTTYSNKSFFKFIYHDGVLESLDPRKQIKYLELVSYLCSKYNIQYILTAIESDIPNLNKNTKNYSSFLNTLNIAVKLSDVDDTTNLFGFKF